MQSDQIKARCEMQVFLDFIRKSKIKIDSQPESRPPPEPDILCKHPERGFIAYELVELCDPNIAQTTAKMIRADKAEPVFMWTADPTSAVIRKKLEKTYKTMHPIELLCYTGGRLVTPDDVIIPTIQHIVDVHGFGMFRRIWLLGDNACEVVSERPL